MIIAIENEDDASLKDPLDVKRFHIEAPCAPTDRAFLDKALAPFAEPDPADADHAWVLLSALQTWPGLEGDDDYAAALEKLTEAAKKYGWFDDGRQAIKAHIEFAKSA